jgi:hypothetical protein
MPPRMDPLLLLLAAAAAIATLGPALASLLGLRSLRMSMVPQVSARPQSDPTLHRWQQELRELGYTVRGTVRQHGWCVIPIQWHYRCDMVQSATADDRTVASLFLAPYTFQPRIQLSSITADGGMVTTATPPCEGAYRTPERWVVHVECYGAEALAAAHAKNVAAYCAAVNQPVIAVDAATFCDIQNDNDRRFVNRNSYSESNLIVIAVIVGIFAIITYVAESKLVRFVPDLRANARLGLAIVAGCAAVQALLVPLKLIGRSAASDRPSQPRETA